MNRLVRTTLGLFADLRAQRIDLTIVIAFAVIIALFVDRCLLWLVALVAPATAASLRGWHPGLRPVLAGVTCAVVFLAICLRPFWIAAWTRTGRASEKK